MGKRKSLFSALKEHQTLDKRAKLQASPTATTSPLQAKRAKSQAAGSKHPKFPATTLIPFDKEDKILFLGEGNFSFAVSCIENHLEHAENVLATCFDTEEQLLSKYPEASDNMDIIRGSCGSVQHSVDAVKLHIQFPTRKFDCVVFMFPHVAAGIADEDRNVRSNQKMLMAFFSSVQHILEPGGMVAVTLAIGKTYDLWDIRGVAKKTGLSVKTSGPFLGAAFPGYQHRRTQKSSEASREFTGGKGEDRPARWTLFTKPEKAKETDLNDNQAHRKAHDDSDSDG